MSPRPLFQVDLRSLLAGAGLPALSQSAVRILQLSKDPTKGPADFAGPIESDPGLASQVLRFANSSYFGFSREISTVKLALSLVGVRTIQNCILWTAIVSLIPNPRCGPFDLQMLWQDSLRRALFAKALAGLLGAKEAEEAFSAALLQDIAVPLLARELPEVYAKLLATREDQRLRLSALERHAFGWTHAQAAAMMVRQWHLPDDLASLIESHIADDLTRRGGRRDPRLVAVAMSALLPAVADPIWQEAGVLEATCDTVCPLGTPRLPALLAQVDTDFAGFAPVMKISLPTKSLIDCYTEVAAMAGT